MPCTPTPAASNTAGPPATDPVAEFARAWAQAQSPPQLPAFLDSDRDSVFDVIRIDLQQRWLRAGLGKRIADYCAELPGIELDDVPADLVYEEFVIRRQAGERVDPQDYLREYPTQAGELAELLALDEGTSTRWVGEQTRGARPHGRRRTPPPTERSPPTGPSRPISLAPRPRTSTAPRRGRRSPAPRSATRSTRSRSATRWTISTCSPASARARSRACSSPASVSMQRLVAVKISADHGSEPQTLARLDHDYIVRIFDQRVLPEQRLKLLYMQFLPGGTLLGVLRWVRATPVEQRNGQLLLDAVDAAMEEKGEIRPSDSSVRDEIASLTWPETVAWLGRRLAEALDYANSRGVLHRDVKPANVLLTAEGVPKLADFNISYSRNTAGTSPVAYFGGSLSYMSPEQLEACHPHRPGTAADLDTRADIFSLGVVLWELLTGTKPFDDAGAGGGDDTQIDAMLHTRRGGLTAAVLDAATRRLPGRAAPRTDDMPGRRPDEAVRHRRRTGPAARPLSRRARPRPRRPAAEQLAATAAPVDLPTGRAGRRRPERRWRSSYNIHHNGSLDHRETVTRCAAEVRVRSRRSINADVLPARRRADVYLCRCVLSVPRGLAQGPHLRRGRHSPAPDRTCCSVPTGSRSSCSVRG